MAAIEGFLLGASLIVAIGAQNAFVLRQGLLGQHVGPVVAFCGLSDALLIGLGVAGAGGLVAGQPALLTMASVTGAAFLLVYGFKAARNACTRRSMEAQASGAPELGSVLAKSAAFTFLNPHVYLDTVVLVGSLSGRHADNGRWIFGLGAASASLIWFMALGYGARLLQPVFASALSWRMLDALIAVIMWTIAAGLLMSV